jgi:hypothetical protein
MINHTRSRSPKRASFIPGALFSLTRSEKHTQRERKRHLHAGKKIKDLAAASALLLRARVSQAHVRKVCCACARPDSSKRVNPFWESLCPQGSLFQNCYANICACAAYLPKRESLCPLIAHLREWQTHTRLSL